jgi:hypothetical protein
MTDDEKPKVAVVIDTGAGGLRTVTGEFGPAKITDNVTLPPAIIGPYGRAWFCDNGAGRKQMGIRDDSDATLAHWVVEAPYAHPVWHSYSIVLLHLRPMFDDRPTIFYVDGATHEMWVYALNPGVDREPLIKTGIVDGSWLFPGNFGAQFIEIADELAALRIKQAVQSICDGQLSPDTDHQRAWQALFGSNMIKKEWR